MSTGAFTPHVSIDSGMLLTCCMQYAGYVYGVVVWYLLVEIMGLLLLCVI